MPYLQVASPRRCNRLQRLHEFEGRKRTCTARLAHHNARRRERHHAKQKLEREGSGGADADEAAAAAAPLRTSKRAAAVRAKATIRRHNRNEACGDDEGSSDEDGSADAAEIAPAKRAALGSAAPGGAGPAPFSGGVDSSLEHALAGGAFDIADWFQFEPPRRAQPPALLPALLAPAGVATVEHLTAYAMATTGAGLPWAESVRAADAAMGASPAVLHVKLPNAAPLQLPPGLPAAFTAAFSTGAPMALAATLRQGCVLLSVDALLAAAEGAA